MKIKIIIMFSISLLYINKGYAQMVTFDPSNLVQGIINSAKNLIETSTTASNMINNYQETKKLYEQGKEYYDALRDVNNLVKDARKVQQTILLIGDISDIYVNSFQIMMTDDNFTLEELSAIAYGYTKLLEQSNETLTELKEIVTPSSLSMSDKERLDMIDNCYYTVLRYRNLVNYFTKKNISVSYLRAQRAGDSDAITALYSDIYNRYW